MRAATGLVSIVLCLAVAPHLSSQEHRALADTDLVVSHVSLESAPAEVRARLGRPLSRRAGAWQYRGLRVLFHNGRVEQVQLTDSRFHTARGLQVGDSVDRLTALYGASCTAGAYEFCRRLDDADPRGMMVDVRQGRVTRIIVGDVFALD